MSSNAESLLHERLRPRRSRLSFVVTGLSSRIGARALLMDRPRGVGGGAKLMSTPRTEGPERQRSASMPESAIGMDAGARDGLAGVGDGAGDDGGACDMALLALVMVSLAPALLALPPLALPALAPAAGASAQRLEQLKTRRREPDEASGLVRGWLPRLQGAAAAAEA